jgi:methyl-accepting chemotaxis protein
MFPRFFEAQVAQRLAVWGAMLGILVSLYAAVELIHTSRMSDVGREIGRVAAFMKAHAGAGAAFSRIAAQVLRGDQQELKAENEKLRELAARETELSGDADARKKAGELALLLDRIGDFRLSADIRIAALGALGELRATQGDAIAGSLERLYAHQLSLLASDRKNKLLIALLAIFVVGQILFLEYRWLVKPIVRMAAVLRNGNQTSRTLNADAFRRDEIGDLARALAQHFGMVSKDKKAASDEREELSTRLARQDDLKRESVAFQNQIADIVRLLENHAGRMSSASENLVAIASDADARAAASVQTTQRVSGSVDVVASSIGAISTALTTVAEDAERTSHVAAAARHLVQSASEDAKALTDAARTIEQVIALIHEVANQTNLLALNATIEAARAGEMGRGFAVVAAEVKQLATRTSRATDDIRGGLQGITSASVRIAERVENLVSSIEEVDEFAASIAASMREQDTNSRTITSSTASSAEDLRNFAETLHRVASLVGDAKGAAQLVTSVSSDLGQQASSLRVAVDRFVETTQRTAA